MYETASNPDIPSEPGKSRAATKLCVMMPALNEEPTIAQTIANIPRQILGIDEIVIIVVDDGSTDDTCAIATQSGAIVVSHARNKGVGAAFHTGVETALSLGADYMVNIDSDGQFAPADIPKLLGPLVQCKADFVSASRFMSKEYYPIMSQTKFWGNKAMSVFISILTGIKRYDVSCGFRAYNREALLQMNLFGHFTYTQETFLDLSFKGLEILEVPIKIRGTREFGKSRVASNLFSYAYRTSKIIIRSFRDYKPMVLFGGVGIVFYIFGLALSIFLFLHYLHTGEFTPHKWAGFVSGVFFCMGTLVLITALLADMLGRVRKTQERILYSLKSKRH